ncbi:MAG: ribonuclease P protein component [Patescibacteria group bacterium]
MNFFSLRLSPHDNVKVIISVSKKVSKSAVVRNTIKRRIRPIVKKLFLKPAQYLLVVRPGAEKLKGKELELELSKLESYKANKL